MQFCRWCECDHYSPTLQTDKSHAHAISASPHVALIIYWRQVQVQVVSVVRKNLWVVTREPLWSRNIFISCFWIRYVKLRLFWSRAYVCVYISSSTFRFFISLTGKFFCSRFCFGWKPSAAHLALLLSYLQVVFYCVGLVTSVVIVVCVSTGSYQECKECTLHSRRRSH